MTMNAQYATPKRRTRYKNVTATMATTMLVCMFQGKTTRVAATPAR